jgi:hypothetical protein
MGSKEGRAFYWRGPGGSNVLFLSLHQHLAACSATFAILATPFIG